MAFNTNIVKKETNVEKYIERMHIYRSCKRMEKLELRGRVVVAFQLAQILILLPEMETMLFFIQNFIENLPLV